MSRILATWNDFTKGEAGWVDKQAIQAGFWQGENVVAYRDGSIGPRSGVLNLAPTGLPAGTVFELGYVDLADNTKPEYVWLRKGTVLTRVAVYDASGFALTGQVFHATAGAFAVANVGDSVEVNPQITIFTVYTDKCYMVNWTTGANGTLSGIAGSPGGTCCELFGDFLVIGHTSGHTNRLQWSEKGDYTTWPAANFLDIGDDVAVGAPGIAAIVRSKDQLVIFLENGQMYTLTGTLGENEVVREFMPGDMMSAPFGAQSPVRARDGSVWFTRREETPNVNDQFYDLPSAMPVSYFGGQRTEYPMLGGYLRQQQFQSNRSSQTVGVTGRSDKSVVLLDNGSRALLFRNGAWSRHVWNANDHYRVTPGSRGDLYMISVDNVAPTLHAWQFELERPPWKFSASGAERLPYTPDDDPSGPGAAAAWFATPQLREPSFGLITVTSIEVMLTSHCTRDTVHNHLELYLQQYDARGAVEKLDPISTPGFGPADLDNAGAGVMSATGVTVGCTVDQSGFLPFDVASDGSFDFRHRVAFYPVGGATRPTPAIRVVARAMRGVSIHEIVVFGTIDPADGQ